METAVKLFKYVTLTAVLTLVVLRPAAFRKALDSTVGVVTGVLRLA